MKTASFPAMAIAACAASALMTAPARADEPSAAQNYPAAVKAAIDHTVQACKPRNANLPSGFVTRQDVNGDGVTDFILDYSGVGCGDDQRAYCGTSGCSVEVYASLPGGRYVKALQEIDFRHSFKRINGRPAVELLEVNGKQTLYWDGKAFSAAPRGAGAVPRNRLDVPVVQDGGDGQMANCMIGYVVGLKAGGDGFLAVRSGPGSRYRKLDELYNGEKVIVFEVRGPWASVVYRTQRVDCSSTRTHVVTYPNRGWVSTRWLDLSAN